MQIIFNSFLLVALSEMGDKTQLLAFSLATRFKNPWAIMAGVLTATVLNHGFASTLGAWISVQIPGRTMAALLGVSFIGFGLWTLKPDQLSESDEGKKSRSKYDAYFSTTFLFFMAEMGDKTQFATVALAAKYQNAFLVTLGTTAGMLFSDGIAVFLGEKFSQKISMKVMRWIAASLFFFFGVVTLFRLILGE